MILVSYLKEGHEQLAILSGNKLFDMDGLHPELPSTMSMFLNYWEDYFPLAQAINDSIKQGKTSLNLGLSVESVNLIAPVPIPASCRKIIFDSRSNNWKLSEADKPKPSFNFINHHNIQGPGDVSCMPGHLEQLQSEWALALVVAKHGRNITADQAEQYIGGYMIMNHISVPGQLISRDISSVMGPWLVTPDELQPYITESMEGRTGTVYNLSVVCSLNGNTLSESNLSELDFTFAEILEDCSYGADLVPGDIICTGVGSKGIDLQDKQAAAPFSGFRLQNGDSITIEIEALGISTCNIMEEDTTGAL